MPIYLTKKYVCLNFCIAVKFSTIDPSPC